MHRINQTLQCTFTSIEDGAALPTAPVPHCRTTSELITYGVQVGHIDTAGTVAPITVSACYDNATDLMVYARSRLLRTDVASSNQQLRIAAYQLHELRIDSHVIGTKENILSDVVRELETVFNAPMDADDLPAGSGNELSGDDAAVPRSYDAWETYLWNGHKFGLEQFGADAAKMNGRSLPALVAELRRRVQAEGQLDVFTGFLGEDVKAASRLSGNMVDVPKYVWFAAVKEGGTPSVVYVVPNGGHAVEASVCGTNRCTAPLYCCEPSSVGKEERIVKDLFKL